MRHFITWMLAGWLVSMSSLVYAQSDWGALHNVPAGSRLRIELPAEVLEARLRGVDELQITVDGRAIPRDEIRQIDWIRSQKAKGAAKGILIGLGLGLVHSFVTAKDNRVAFGLGFLGPRYAVLGAMFGMGLSQPRIETVYRR